MKTISRELGQRMWGGMTASTIGGGSGEGGGGGVSAAWVDGNYLSKAFFNQLFAVHVNDHIVVTDDGEVISDDVVPRTLLPNEIIPAEPTVETDPETGYVTTTTTTLASIEGLAGLWTNFFVSALGQSSGGGGGDVLFEPLLSINASGLAAPGAAQNGMTVVWNNTTHKWEYGSAGGGGGTVTSITAGTGLSGGTITASGTIALSQETQTAIAAGVTAYGWGNHANAGYLTASAIIDMATKTWVNQQGFLTSSALNGYATQSWVNQQGFLKSVSGTFWGNSWSNGGTLSGNIIIDNGYAIRFKNRGGDHKNVLTLNSSNQLAIGFNTRQMGYVTDIQGGTITFATNNGTTGGTDNRLEVGEFSSAGRFWIKQGTQGLRIGNGLLTWDSANNALKVSDYNGNSANLYALGGVSALGFSSSGGTTSINSLTVNGGILVKDYAGDSKKALSVALAASASDASRLIIGEGWKDYLHDTVIRGYNIQFETGQHDLAAVTINGAGMATFNYYLKSLRYYLDPDASRYLYVSGSNLYFYNGSTSIQIA